MLEKEGVQTPNNKKRLLSIKQNKTIVSKNFPNNKSINPNQYSSPNFQFMVSRILWIKNLLINSSLPISIKTFSNLTASFSTITRRGRKKYVSRNGNAPKFVGKKAKEGAKIPFSRSFGGALVINEPINGLAQSNVQSDFAMNGKDSYLCDENVYYDDEDYGEDYEPEGSFHSLDSTSSFVRKLNGTDGSLIQGEHEATSGSSKRKAGDMEDDDTASTGSKKPKL